MHIPYDDSQIIHGRIDWLEAVDIPPILPYFDVPFTEEGIMQTWLLDNLTDFMPKGWHSNYSKKTFIFDADCIKGIFLDEEGKEVREKLKSIDLKSLQPKIRIDGDKAVLEYAYWNDWRGLIRATTEVEKNSNSVNFTNPQTEVLVQYKCGIIF